VTSKTNSLCYGCSNFSVSPSHNSVAFQKIGIVYHFQKDYVPLHTASAISPLEPLKKHRYTQKKATTNKMSVVAFLTVLLLVDNRFSTKQLSDTLQSGRLSFLGVPLFELTSIR